MKIRVRRVGILTAGGDAPGLNAVIRGIVKAAILKHKIEVTGITDGFEGLLMKDGFSPLSLAGVRGILPRGGTIIGTRNTGKFDPFFRDAPESARARIMRAAIASLKRNRIDCLITIGGEGTLSVAQKFHEAGFPTIGVPKTIDNDLSATDYTFGFATAVQTSSDALDRLTTTAESHDRVMILEVMGRNAGWIALSSGIAGGADIILIPEIPFSVEKVVRHIKLRESTGATAHIIVVAEGARPRDKACLYYTASGGKKRLGGIAAWLADELSGRIRNEVRPTVLGHIQRGGTPTAFDRILGSRFGAHAVEMAMKNKFGEMVCLRTPKISSVPIADAIKVYNIVDPGEGMIRSARAIGLAFGD